MSAPDTSLPQPPPLAQPKPQDTTGMSQIGPSIEAPPQRQRQWKASGIPALALGIVEQVKARKKRELEATARNFVQHAAGLQDSQGQIQEAQTLNKRALQEFQSATTPEEKQAAQQKLIQSAQMLKKAQQGYQTSSTNLKDMFNGPQGQKHAKMLEKAYGWDEKTVNSPERAALIASIQKEQGVDAQTAKLLSLMPQKQQLSPEAQRQSMLQHAGVVGKPATGGQILASQTAQRGQDIRAVTAGLNRATQAGIAMEKLTPLAEAKYGLTPARDDKGSILRNPDGTVQWRNMTPEERQANPVLKAQDELKDAQAAAQRANADSKMNPDNPGMRIKAAEANARIMDAQARMMAAQAAMLRAQVAQGKEPPEVAKARITADMLETEYAKAQQYVKTPSPTNDTALVFSYVRAQVAGAGRMTNVEIEQALKSGSFDTRYSNMYNRATKGELDPDFRQQLADTIKIASDKARLTAQKYDATKPAQNATDDEILRGLEELAKP